MKIQVRKMKTITEKVIDEKTGKEIETKKVIETGFVEEKEIETREISAFSLNSHVRTIGINKEVFKLTLKSWKEVKKELTTKGLLSRFNLEKVK